VSELVSSVSPKGQITVPVEVRRLLGIKPKDKVTFRVEGTRVEITAQGGRLDESYMAIPPLKRRRGWKEIERDVSEEQALRVAAEGTSEEA
jgi:AbrB family looped-hinge helix DNA binding protein